MRPSQMLLRPLTSRATTGIAFRSSPSIMEHKRSILTLKDHVFFSKAIAEGPGRHGIVKSNGDAPLELNMSMPRVAGGKGDGQNPEQLFAMSYASCFLGALQLAAARAQKMDIAENAKVHARVFLGHPTEPDIDGFGLRVEINVENCDDDAVISAAHDFCPYSRALRDGIEVKVTKT